MLCYLFIYYRHAHAQVFLPHAPSDICFLCSVLRLHSVMSTSLFSAYARQNDLKGQEGMTTIPFAAFKDCERLTTINLPNFIISIE